MKLLATFLLALTVSLTAHADMWCGPATADLYCTDELTKLPMKYQADAEFITSDGGLAGYPRYTHAESVAAPPHRHYRRHAYRGLGVTFDGGHGHVFLGRNHYWQRGLRKYEPTGPIIIERVRVPDDRTTGITTRTDTEVRQGGRLLLLRRGGTAVRD